MPQQGFKLVEVPGMADPVQFPDNMADEDIGKILAGYTQRNFALNPPSVQPPALRQGQGMQTEQIPGWQKGFLPQEMPGAGEGANLASGLAEYSKDVAVPIGSGAKNISQGNVARGAHEIIGGVGTAMAPAVIPAAAAAPLATGAVLGASYLGGKAAKYGASALGATPDQAALAEDIGNLATGYGVVKGAGGIKALMEGPGTPAQRLSVALSKTLPKSQWAKVNERLNMLGDAKVAEVAGGARNVTDVAGRFKNKSLALGQQFSDAIAPLKDTDITAQTSQLSKTLLQQADENPALANSYNNMANKVSEIKTLGQLDKFVADNNKTPKWNGPAESLVRQQLTETVRGLTGQDFSPLRLEQSHWMSLSRAAQKAAIPEQLAGLQSKVTSPGMKLGQAVTEAPMSKLSALMKGAKLIQPSANSLIRGIKAPSSAAGTLVRSVAPEAQGPSLSSLDMENLIRGGGNTAEQAQIQQLLEQAAEKQRSWRMNKGVAPNAPVAGPQVSEPEIWQGTSVGTQLGGTSGAAPIHTDAMAQAKAQLGPNASLSDILQRAAEIQNPSKR